MKKGLKLLAVLVILATMLTACGGGNGGSGDTGEKVFTVAIGAEPRLPDPHYADDAVSNYVAAQMYEGLFSFTEDGNVQKELCDDYTVSDDGLVYTFTLIDAQWSDGEPITADQFVYGMKRALNYGVEDSYYSSKIKDYVKNAYLIDTGTPIADMDDLGVRAIDEKTLEITLERPCAYFLQLLVQKTYYPIREEFVELGSSNWAANPDVPVTGAFKLESINTKEQVTLVKNDNYRNADEVELDKVIYLIMTDQQAQLSAFKTGEIDFAMNVPPEVVQTYDGTAEFFKIDPYVINYFVTINASGAGTGNEALTDVNVRRALALAVDRNTILTILDGGSLQYPLYGFVPKGIPGVDGDFRTEADAEGHLLDTDVEEAKRLLAEAGYSTDNPLKLTYKTNSSQMHNDVAQALQAMWKEIGVEVELVTPELRVFFDERTDGDFDLARHANSADYMDPMIYLSMYHTGSQKAKVVDDAAYDAMLDAANAELDLTKRMEMLHDAEEYFVKDMVYVIPLFGYSNPLLLKEGISGIETGPDGAVQFRFVRLP